jgi:hypothetical protein
VGLGGAKPDRIAAASAKHGTANVALNTFCLQPSCVIEVPVSVDRLLDGVALMLAGALETQDERGRFRRPPRAPIRLVSTAMFPPG